jgi:NADH-quinone oxidoreductase subunit L
MQLSLPTVLGLIILCPLTGAAVAGLLGHVLGRVTSQSITILGIFLSFAASLYVFNDFVFAHHAATNITAYTWATSGVFQFNVGFLLDNLTAIMLVVVTFVSLLVHIYSIGYMRSDPGYTRFFSYISLFTFAMLMLVTANNFFQLFFGWEAVGLVSYLLIGFWFNREAANFGSLKAFIVNRVGDFGFILGIGGIIAIFGSVDFSVVFMQAPHVAAKLPTISLFTHTPWSVISVICILLFIGAMGKSAQMPLHIWLPESMEGPTPISALIHAATMVTAGVYMVARLSPLYELSAGALSFVLMIGATTALFTGILGIVQNDIKRVIAYSTLSQLGYMVAALGASAFAASIFHLVTHAAFKALLFLAAGSVILALHHEQDMRKMGGLRRYLPLTYICFLIGALALTAIPPFSGFYSKDAIIEAVHLSTIKGAGYAYVALMIGVFITALYTFRAFFMTFHGEERFNPQVRTHLQENGWVIKLPLILLAIAAIMVGFLLAYPMLYQHHGMLTQSLYVLPNYNVLAKLTEDYHGVWQLALHAVISLPFWLAVGGIVAAWWCYVYQPRLPTLLASKFNGPYHVLLAKYGFDDFNQFVFVRGTRGLAQILYKYGDVRIIDEGLVNGSGRLIAWAANTLKRLQTGYLYHYALAMIIGVLALILWQILIG